MIACSPGKLPPARVNCGWFTGEEFKKGSGWACVPVTPVGETMMTETLNSKTPNSTLQYQENARGGNHCPKMEKVVKFAPPYGAIGAVGGVVLGVSGVSGVSLRPLEPRFSLFAVYEK